MKKTDINFVPSDVNTSPDYYCTWQTQLYATSDGKPDAQRKAMNEESMFSDKFPYNWTSFYEKAREDLIFVMDDSWDVPPEGDEKKYGSLVLDRKKFPSFYKNDDSALALKTLCEKVKSLGWRGLGGWVCAQESPGVLYGQKSIDYWTERLKDANKADVRYWKVDWGKKAGDAEFRKMLTELGKKYAPQLVVENAFNADFVSFSDVFRTYDVPAIMSLPMTMEKLAVVLKNAKPNGEVMSLVNCEDEAYIAAAGGFTMGIMRHPYAGAFPDGREDMAFPNCHRDLKQKTGEVLRAVRWHRIAPAFYADCKEVHISDKILCDTWELQKRETEIESWWFDMAEIKNDTINDVIQKKACAAISRRMPLPKVYCDDEGDIPYVVAAKNPNGAVSAAFLARTRGRKYFTPKCDIFLEVGNANIFGFFGFFKSLSLKFADDISTSRIFAQDLAEKFSYDISDEVDICGNMFTVSFETVKRVLNISDKSEPGFLLKLI